MNRGRPAATGLVALAFTCLALFTPAAAAFAVPTGGRPTGATLAPDHGGRPGAWPAPPRQALALPAPLRQALALPALPRQSLGLPAPGLAQRTMPPAIAAIIGFAAVLLVVLRTGRTTGRHPRAVRAVRLPAVRAPPTAARSPRPA